MPHVMQTRVEQVQADTAAAIAALRERTGASSIVTVGFCFGGTQSFMAATSAELDLDGAVGFYAGLVPRREGAPEPIEHAPETRCPVLGLFGGADENILPEHIEAYERGLQRGRRRARDRHLPGRAALVLRPLVQRARRGVRGRVAARARLPAARRAPVAP